jgi:NAD-dependent DNA ligase
VNDELGVKLLEHFATSLNIPYVAAGTVKKLYAAGVKTIARFIRLTADEVAAMDGFQKVSAEKVATAIRERLATATCNDLMVASNAFGRGFGQRKIALITGAFPDLPASAPSLAELKAVDGLGDKTAQEFLKNLPAFMSFLKDTGLVCHKPAAPGAAGPGAPAAAAAPALAAALAGKSVVFTGFRNKDWEAALAAAGAKLSTSVSGKTFVVVAADPYEESGKLKKAADLGVRIVSRDAFAAEYGL